MLGIAAVGRGQDAQSIPEPQRRAAGVGAEFHDDLGPGKPQQMLEHPQILGEFHETDTRVRIRHMLAHTILPVSQQAAFGSGLRFGRK
nr:hypothetical protein [Streptomyces sp. GbtcB6]